jgi:hypothetical protein
MVTQEFATMPGWKLAPFITQLAEMAGAAARHGHLDQLVMMPDELPSCWADVPDRLWRWLHNGLKTFVSFRSPKAPTEPKP